MKSLPTKTRTSFDIPKLLWLIKKAGYYDTSASFDDLMTVRSYLVRHPEIPFRLSQEKVEGGYRLTLRYKDEIHGLQLPQK
jgi:hypothetical protein